MLHDYLNVMVLFLVVGLGAALAKAGWLTQSTNSVFTRLLINVALPATLLLSITRDFTRDEFLTLLPDVILPGSVILTLMVLAYLVARLFGVAEQDRGLFIGLCSMSSTIFFGIPITLAVYGSHGLPYALITYASQTVIYWTLGLYLLQMSGSDSAAGKGMVKTIVKEVLNMPLVTFFCGVFILLMGFRLPGVINEFLTTIGGMTSALAMLVVGTIIFISGLKSIEVSRNLCIVVLFRFIIAPLVVLLLGWVFSVNSQMVKITMLICSLPIPNTTVILAEKYKVNVAFATSSLTFSIGVYLIFLPVILFVIHSL